MTEATLCCVCLVTVVEIYGISCNKYIYVELEHLRRRIR